MKIISISDTHEQAHLVHLPPGDVLVHAGDITNRGSLAKLGEFTSWLKKQDFAHKIIICGNHDFCFENANHDIAVNMIHEAGAVYLQDSSVTIEGVKFWGSPITPWFHDWAFNVQRGPAIAKKWAMIPDDTNVLITHGPPRGILDLVEEDFGYTKHEGCQDLLDRTFHLPQLKLHVFGHLHFNGGKTVKAHGKTFVNAAICDDRHDPSRYPQVVEI